MGDLPKGGGWTKAILLETRFGFVSPVSGIQLQFGREIFCAYGFLGQFDDPTTPSALLRACSPQCSATALQDLRRIDLILSQTTYRGTNSRWVDDAWVLLRISCLWGRQLNTVCRLSLTLSVRKLTRPQGPGRARWNSPTSFTRDQLMFLRFLLQ
jgi:hypothetical protein